MRTQHEIISEVNAQHANASQSELAALRAENAKLRELLAEALNDNYWHAKGCESDLTADCTCWVGKARRALESSNG